MTESKDANVQLEPVKVKGKGISPGETPPAPPEKETED